jgi:hypothetical protein
MPRRGHRHRPYRLSGHNLLVALRTAACRQQFGLCYWCGEPMVTDVEPIHPKLCMTRKGGPMRLIILALGLLAFPVTACTAGVPNMTCKAERTVMMLGPTEQPLEYKPTDVFRVANGRLYHRWSGREEYFYNDIREVEFGRYVSGHMVFVMDYDKLRGYVVIAARPDWRVVYLDCKP